MAFFIKCYRLIHILHLQIWNEFYTVSMNGCFREGTHAVISTAVKDKTGLTTFVGGVRSRAEDESGEDGWGVSWTTWRGV